MMQDVSYLAISCLAKANMARSCKIFPRIFTRVKPYFMNSHYMAYFFSTKRILGISTMSRVDHLTAQTREIECTREVLPSVIDDLGMINV